MKSLGLTERFIQESKIYEGLVIGRVSSQYKDLYKVIAGCGELTAEVSGKFRYHVKGLAEYPAVGDFVMVDRTDSSKGSGVIHHVLTRKSAFTRKMAGTTNDTQIVASNIDTVFVCMSLNNDFNLRRLERYLAIAWNSMATPVIMLTKSDLCHSLSERLAEVYSVAVGTDVVVTSSVNPEGYKEVAKYMVEQKSGKIINISSKSGKKGGLWLAAYSSAKFGVVGLTQSVATDLAPFHINVNAICPGNVFSTPMWDLLDKEYSVKLGVPPEQVRKIYVEKVPLGRGCTVEDISNLAVFLASSQSDYMTGQAINLTGGQEVH